MPGPPRTPTATLRARGSSLAKSRESEAKFDEGLPTAPDWLTPQGRAVWDRLAEQLTRAGIVQQVDADALAMYAEFVAEFERLTAAVKEHGLDAALLRSRRQAMEAAHRLGQQFGFTPASRSRVQAAERAQDEDQHFPRGL